MKHLETLHGKRFAPPELLGSMAKAAEHFYVREGSIHPDETELPARQSDFQPSRSLR
jgi:hypothetical protein